MIIQIIKGSKDINGFNDTLELVKYIADIADEKNASYVKIIDMSKRLIITDYFIIISARNSRATKAIEDDIAFKLKKMGLLPMSVSGSSEGNWILMDYDDFIIHIFTDEFRQYYDLERLWKDSREIEYKGGDPKQAREEDFDG